MLLVRVSSVLARTELARQLLRGTTEFAMVGIGSGHCICGAPVRDSIPDEINNRVTGEAATPNAPAAEDHLAPR